MSRAKQVMARILRPRPLMVGESDQPTKFGVWGSRQLTGAYWRIRPGHEMVGYLHPQSDEIIVAVEGCGQVICVAIEAEKIAGAYVPQSDQKVIPPEKSVIPEDAEIEVYPFQQGEAVGILPGVLHSVRNTGGADLVLMVLTAPEAHSSVYLVR